MITKVSYDQIPFDPRIKGLCAVPYSGNPSGCPNYGKKEGCPPGPIFSEYFRPDGDFYVVYTAFPIGEFIGKKVSNGVGGNIVRYPDSPKKGIEKARSIEEALRKARPDWPESYFPKNPGEEGWEGYERTASHIRWWQPKARKAQKREEDTFRQEHPGLFVNGSPEALGVNITGLMANLGIPLEWRWPVPVDARDALTYRVSIAGVLPETNVL